MRILRDVGVIVIIHKRMPARRVVEPKRRYREKQAHHWISLFRRREWTLRLARSYGFFLGWQQKDLTTEDTEDTEAVLHKHLYGHCDTRQSFIEDRADITVEEEDGNRDAFKPDQRSRSRLRYESLQRARPRAFGECLSGLPGTRTEPARIHTAVQLPLPVIYDEVRLDLGFRLDILVENLVVVEIKAVDAISPIHQAQLLRYLKLSHKHLGLLINFFNVVHLKDGIRRMVSGSPPPSVSSVVNSEISSVKRAS